MRLARYLSSRVSKDDEARGATAIASASGQSVDGSEASQPDALCPLAKLMASGQVGMRGNRKENRQACKLASRATCHAVHATGPWYF